MRGPWVSCPELGSPGLAGWTSWNTRQATHGPGPGTTAPGAAAARVDRLGTAGEDRPGVRPSMVRRPMVPRLVAPPCAGRTARIPRFVALRRPAARAGGVAPVTRATRVARMPGDATCPRDATIHTIVRANAVPANIVPSDRHPAEPGGSAVRTAPDQQIGAPLKARAGLTGGIPVAGAIRVPPGSQATAPLRSARTDISATNATRVRVRERTARRTGRETIGPVWLAPATSEPATTEEAMAVPAGGVHRPLIAGWTVRPKAGVSAAGVTANPVPTAGAVRRRGGHLATAAPSAMVRGVAQPITAECGTVVGSVEGVAATGARDQQAHRAMRAVVTKRCAGKGLAPIAAGRIVCPILAWNAPPMSRRPISMSISRRSRYQCVLNCVGCPKSWPRW
ncbi:hypothetical protein SAMN05443377_104137 [Propionibacterium cyclohexanicum]|uniref:Uncharacterized protein n=1 Tax=Propionibacterium cyclohexanicum TaxID=64702 RepID=A0A1H9QWX7_9ACTN|nr:hypothetical protein SAMN05443377_104137 [Propionibacterium cyclohexanicum]